MKPVNPSGKKLKTTGFSEIQLLHVYKALISKINFIDDILVSDEELKLAYALTKDIDEDDTPFVALANSLSAYLWTGDKKLLKGLASKQFKRIISTEQLHETFVKKRNEGFIQKKKQKINKIFAQYL